MNNLPSCHNLNHQHHEHEMAGIMNRPNWIDEVGVKILGHTHNYDHQMTIMEGEARVVGHYADGEIAFDVIVRHKDTFLVKATIKHEITCTVAPYMHICQFPCRTPSGHIAGENTHWPGSSI